MRVIVGRYLVLSEVAAHDVGLRIAGEVDTLGVPVPGLLVELTGPPVPLMTDSMPPEPLGHGEQVVEVDARRIGAWNAIVSITPWSK